MKKIKVSIVNPTTLRLDERGDIGDMINLQELQSVDTSSILEAIRSKKDSVYQTLLSNELKQLESEKTIALSELETTYKEKLNTLMIEKEKQSTVIESFEARLVSERSSERLKAEAEFNLQRSNLEKSIAELQTQLASQKTITEMEVTQQKEKVIQQKQDEIRNLQHQITSLKDQEILLLEKTKMTVEAQMNETIQKNTEEINRLNTEIASLKSQDSIELQRKESEIRLLELQLKGKDDLLKLEIEKTLIGVKQEFLEQINQKEAEINRLRSEKSRTQIKMLGEELERECNEIYRSYALSGFENCKWYKYNNPVKDNPDDKATKADYIFEVYSDSRCLKEDLLISVCCEMKSESSESKTKTKNADHYKKLDDDRRKKNLQYSLLISELEWDTVNDSPIKKITDYENMYLVRPAYFISFLSLIQSLAQKYRELLNEKKRDEMNFIESKKILDEFESFKTTYLDKPLTSLQSDVEEIKKEATKAYNSSYTIMGLADDIITKKISDIRIKIDRFDIRKTARRVDKIENKIS